LVEDRKVNQSMLLLDLGLPIIDGYQVLRKLKQDPRTERLPVIMLTTVDDATRLTDCYQLGCKVCITKPVRYQDLTEAIRALGLFLSVITFPDGA
jgi:CheY-like chemotaxis protein